MTRLVVIGAICATALAACAGSPYPMTTDAAVSYDAADSAALITRCDETLPGCGAPEADYVPVADGEGIVVWTPSGDRYANEPTLVRADDGTWHVFANSASGVGSPWGETQIIHATAPSLLGPWTEQPDILTTRDADAYEVMLWAPFVIREGNEYVITYAANDRQGNGAQRVARSTDLFHWRRTTEVFPGGRDAMVLRTDDGRDLLYATGTTPLADGPHDVVQLAAGHALSNWTTLDPALTNPVLCTEACWGFYESPYVVRFGRSFYLFVTHTVSNASTYEHTEVFRSRDATHFAPQPIAELQAHGGEIHVEDGRMYLTRGGWTNYIGAARRGLSVLPIAWRRVE